MIRVLRPVTQRELFQRRKLGLVLHILKIEILLEAHFVHITMAALMQRRGLIALGDHAGEAGSLELRGEGFVLVGEEVRVEGRMPLLLVDGVEKG